MRAGSHDNNKLEFTGVTLKPSAEQSAGGGSNAGAEDEVNIYYASYVLFLLLIAYILSFVDRNVLALLIEPIRSDFSITDTQFSLLHGLAFALFYTFLGLPIGRWADRGNRRNIIVIGVALWSLMTCLCGAAKSFFTLFLARVGVGVGEAALSPPAHSLLSDLFRPERLPMVFAIYSTGIILGSGFAFIIGGHIYEYFETRDAWTIPLLGALKPWQSTFIVVGFPGLLVAALLMTIREPERKGRVQEAGELMPLSEVLAYLWQRRGAYLSLIIGVSMLSILGYGTLAWYPEFLQRTYGVSRTQAGSQFGQLFIVAGLIGSIALAYAAGWFGRRGVSDINMRIIFVVALLEFVPAVIAPLMPTMNGALAFAAVLIALQYGYFGIAISALQLVTPNEMRAQVSAVLLFATNMLGLIVGPTVVALLTDYAFGTEESVRYSLAVVAAVFAPAAALVIWRGLPHYRELLVESEARQAI